MNTTTLDPMARDAPSIDAGLFARGMAVLRIFFGVILFANGLAKLFGFTRVDGWGYFANLIDRPTARGILDFEVNRREVFRGAPQGTRLPLLKDVTNDVVLANWGFFEWFLTLFELGIGALLIVGLLTRGAALLDLGQQLFLAAVYYSSNRWMFEQPHEYVPLFILAAVPAGRVWGFDAWIVRNSSRLRRWPF